MLAKRIIPCLDVKNGRTVKGINFKQLDDMGNPVEIALAYVSQGADELVFLDISATNERRKTMLSWVKDVARQINIPFTVGGGINAVDDVYELLNAGADKISVNSAAVNRPDLIDELASRFGTQCIVLAVDTLLKDNNWFVYTHGGQTATSIHTNAWIKEAVNRGAGEILLTSIDHDGTKQGFALELTQQIATLVDVPIIASGGAGNEQHFLDVFTTGKADAALAAGIFHRGELTIPHLKNYLKQNGLNIRL